MKRILIFASLMSVVNFCYGIDDKEKLAYAMQYACDSFIQELGFYSPYAEFESCTLRETLDVIPNPLEIKYKVKGEFAEKIEQQLHETYQLPKFIKKESVAGWETSIYYNLSDPNYTVDIIFISQETLVQKHEDWEQIPYFYLWFAKRKMP